MKVVVAGGTGFIGRALCAALAGRGDEVLVLTRRAEAVRQELGAGVRAVEWSPAELGAWAAALEGVDAVVNLAGESLLGKRWSEDRKAALRASRVDLTRTLVRAIGERAKPPRVLVSSSAVGYYGPHGDEELSEEAPPGSDFLAQLCVDWEAEAHAARAFGARVVLLRTGIVLGEGGGALAQMLPAFKLFMGGPLGGGRQAFPWIHREDLVGFVLMALDRADVEGPVNAVGPEPMSMREFCKKLGAVMHRPSWAPVPAFVAKALFGGEAAGALLHGQRAVPERALALGYRFRFPTAESALRDILGRKAA